MCPFGSTYNSSSNGNACHTTNANTTVSWRDLAAKLKWRQDFQWSLWFLSSLCECVVVFLRETIKKLNRKLASHFVLKGKFNIKGLHCTHGRQGATHKHTHTRVWGKSRVQRVPCKVLSTSSLKLRQTTPAISMRITAKVCLKCVFQEHRTGNFLKII